MRFTIPLIWATLAAAASILSAPDTFTVHEWGTFTSVAAEDGSASDWDALGCKDDLPRFVNDFGFRNFKFRLQGTIRMETPVLYFYNPTTMDALVSVRFPHGVITEWYPSGEPAIYRLKTPSDRNPVPVKITPSLSGFDTSLRNVVGAIEWRDIKIKPNNSPALPNEAKPSRYYAARATDAAPVAVGEQNEKFLFYRGVARFQPPLSAQVLPGRSVLVGNVGSDPVPTVILFENRGGHFGYRNAGTITATATLGMPSLNNDFAGLRSELQEALVAQGLYQKEAQAMIDTWRDSWFEEGARLIYIVPAQTIDALLPLQIEPPPSQVRRVFVGRIELITPETQQAVEEAIAKGDWRAMERYRRFLAPILNRIYSADAAQADEIENAVRNFELTSGACESW
jgi:hypothetical protein